MKIAFSTYSHAFRFWGGGEVIFSKCKEYLEKKGHTVEVFTEWDDRIKEFDLLHHFSVVKSGLPLLEKAKKEGVKIALHPIYWPQTEYALKGDFKFFHRMKKLAYALLVRLNLTGTHVRRMMELADILFPNSEREGELFAKEFNLPLEKMHVVHDGVDNRFFQGDKQLFMNKYREEGFVLYVGRIEPRKNVLGLVKALKKSNLRLIIIGDADKANQHYLDQCKANANENTRFLGRISHESDLLPSAYAAANVLALPSWYETPGIVALEAAAAGTNVVITNRGCTEEYFEGFAEYVDPLDENGIRAAVEAAVQKPKDNTRKQYIQKKFTWEKVAEETLEGYKKL